MPAVPLSQVAVHLRPEDNIAVAARNLSAGPGNPVNGNTFSSAAASAWATSSPSVDIARARPSTSTARSSASPARTSPPATTSTSTMSPPTPSSATTPSASDCPPPPAAGRAPRFWMGYDRGARPSTRYGTRNYIAIISTVNCSASTSKYISERFRADRPAQAVSRTSTASWPSRTRPAAPCSTTAPDHSQLDRTLAGFAKHPNVAAYILIGLGCETGQAIHLIENEHLDSAQRHRQDAAAGPDDPGMRRHRQDGRGRRARPSPSCCRASTTCSADHAAGRASSSSAPTAAARTATAA